MITLQIADKKAFMKYLLIDNMFDSFELVQGSITTYNTIDIDGQVRREFYGSEYDASDLYGYDYTPWPKAKELAYQLIKGKYTPLSFKFVLRANKALQSSILQELPAESTTHISSLIINVRFDSTGLSITSGTSSNSFSMDRSADEAWDEWVNRFIQDKL